jgi:hypothetical protein
MTCRLMDTLLDEENPVKADFKKSFIRSRFPDDI